MGAISKIMSDLMAMSGSLTQQSNSLGKYGAIAHGISGLGSLMSGFSNMGSAGSEAEALEQQGALALEEARINAQQRAREGREFKASQSVQFAGSGVQIAGSPALVLARTHELNRQEVDAIMRRGQAVSDLYNDRAKSMRSKGRNSMLGGLLSAGVSGFNAYGAMHPTNPNLAPTQSPSGPIGPIGPQITEMDLSGLSSQYAPSYNNFGIPSFLR